ncbi:flagellin N-terminal helical domain-containing protein [Leisingera caerulea]|uniref:flagellin N-terminal helical domain-containing protein n=1 Tax=Leisingera caerulea TaxID=506591 RepID=UPI00040CF747|nr:flagellin [Leisingera caerulea]
MTISTISTTQQSNNMRLIIARQNEELAKLTMESSTGFKKDVYAENPGSATQSLKMRSLMASTESFQTSNKLLEGKLETAYDTLSNATAVARDFQDLSLAGEITSMNRSEYRQQAEDTLHRMVSALNTTYGGEFLFSGLETGQKPLEINAAGTGVTYLGDTTGKLSARIDGTTDLNYGIRADDPAITDVFDALNTVLSTNLDALSDTDFEILRDNVTGLMNQGITGMTSLAADLGNNQAILENKITDQASLLKIYNNAVADVEVAEPEETALRLKQLMNQLEVSYQVTSRISGMSLLNYL